MLIQLLLLTLLQDSPKAEPGEITGKVVSIADGDTITILTAEKKQVKIRLNGIDAPERGQPFGRNAKQFISDKIGGQMVRVVTHGEDRYGRTIGNVYSIVYDPNVFTPYGDEYHLKPRLVNLELVRAGLAWHYVRYAPDNKELAEAEKQAREKKLGLWADASPVAPWDWRKQEADKKKAGK